MRNLSYSALIKSLSLMLLGLFISSNFAFNYSAPNPTKPAIIEYPKNYFRSPLDIKLFLAGTFGEMRPNHFHSGIDIRTNAQEGLPIFAVGDGYISRIRVQASGFGYALYITHPNGFVSVYAHLQRYVGRMAEEMKKMQYEKKSFEIDTLLSPTLIPVNKGQLIALGGNSGSSQGPHLHFEMRDAVTEEPINPLLFGFEVEDAVNPIIQAISFYPLDENTSINQLKNKQRYTVTGAKPSYTLNNGSIIQAWGKIGLGIECIDLQSGSSNQNGVYSIELKKNGERIFYSQMERFLFKDTRAINSHCDFKERNYSGRWVQKSFVDPGNPLTLYKGVDNRGAIQLEAGEIYNMEYIVKDIKGNTSIVNFAVNCSESNPYNYVFSKTSPDKNILGYNTTNTVEVNNFKAFFPVGSFYDSVLVPRSVKPGTPSAFSSIYTIGTKDIPVHGLFDVSIKPEKYMSDYQKSKAVVVQSGRGSAGGVWKDGYLVGKSKVMGSFYISADSIPPSIRPVNISNGKRLSASSRIIVKIGDNLSGIKSYNAYIDDQWVVMEYDAKYAQLAYTFDEKCGPGKHVFRVVVSDNKNNTSQYLASFVR